MADRTPPAKQKQPSPCTVVAIHLNNMGLRVGHHQIVAIGISNPEPAELNEPDQLAQAKESDPNELGATPDAYPRS